eukprot:2236170-Prymnesium_polylepis.1
MLPTALAPTCGRPCAHAQAPTCARPAHVQALVDFTGGTARKRSMPDSIEDEATDGFWAELMIAQRRGVLQA